MIDPVMQFFNYEHLKPEMQAVSKPFCDLARALVGMGSDGKFEGAPPEMVPRNQERTKALNKLLEAKDAAVRALIFKAD